MYMVSGHYNTCNYYIVRENKLTLSLGLCNEMAAQPQSLTCSTSRTATKLNAKNKLHVDTRIYINEQTIIWKYTYMYMYLQN